MFQGDSLIMRNSKFIWIIKEIQSDKSTSDTLFTRSLDDRSLWVRRNGRKVFLCGVCKKNGHNNDEPKTRGVNMHYLIKRGSIRIHCVDNISRTELFDKV